MAGGGRDRDGPGPASAGALARRTGTRRCGAGAAPGEERGRDERTGGSRGRPKAAHVGDLDRRRAPERIEGRRRRPAGGLTSRSTGPVPRRTGRRTADLGGDRAPAGPAHTQRRLSSERGTVPTPVATMLAHPGWRVAVAGRAPSTVMLVGVAMIDTAPYRTTCHPVGGWPSPVERRLEDHAHRSVAVRATVDQGEGAQGRRCHSPAGSPGPPAGTVGGGRRERRRGGNGAWGRDRLPTALAEGSRQPPAGSEALGRRPGRGGGPGRWAATDDPNGQERERATAATPFTRVNCRQLGGRGAVTPARQQLPGEPRGRRPEGQDLLQRRRKNVAALPVTSAAEGER